MKPSQYHDVLSGLDRALIAFHDSSTDLSEDDQKLKVQIAAVRAQVLFAESRHPFQLNPEGLAASPRETDPDLTQAPWSAGRNLLVDHPVT